MTLYTCMWNRTVNYDVDKIQPLDPIVIQFNVVHSFTAYSSNYCFNIIVESTTGSTGMETMTHDGVLQIHTYV
jgi:hypothetical protein